MYIQLFCIVALEKDVLLLLVIQDLNSLIKQTFSCTCVGMFTLLLILMYKRVFCVLILQIKVGGKLGKSGTIHILHGISSGFDIMYLALVDRSMQIRFGLKVVWES